MNFFWKEWNCEKEHQQALRHHWDTGRLFTIPYLRVRTFQRARVARLSAARNEIVLFDG
jgi:hypothetical protein